MIDAFGLGPYFRAAVAMFFLAGSLPAHHSPASYDAGHIITLTGIVTRYEFVNPHTRIYFEVKTSEGNDSSGNVEMWVAESAAPQRLHRAGWRPDSLKPGDRITVTGSPMKNGSKLLSVRTLTGPDGKVLTQGVE